MAEQRSIPPRAFVEAMSESLWAAAAAARWLAGKVHNTPKLAERTASKQALTEADCVSQEILLAALRSHFPWIELEAEEDTPGVLPFASNVSDQRAILDPIDGTLHYLDRDGVYAILVGLEREGRAEAALIALPERDLLLRAVRGEGAELARVGGPFRRVRCDAPPEASSSAPAELLISKTLGRSAQDALRARGYSLASGCGAAIGVSPLLPGTRGALRISDNPDGLSRRTWISALVTQEAGGVVETLEGPLPPRYEPGVPGILVGADPAQVRELRHCAVS